MHSQMARFMGPTWGPPGSCRPEMGPMFAPWTLLSGLFVTLQCHRLLLHWRHNEPDGVSNQQPHDCLLNSLFRRRSKKTSKFRATGLCAGIHRWPVNSPHKGPVTRKMFPFDDVIMGRAHVFTLSQMDLLCPSLVVLYISYSIDTVYG